MNTYPSNSLNRPLTLLVNNKKTLLLNENKIHAIEKKLIKSNYEIQKV